MTNSNGRESRFHADPAKLAGLRIGHSIALGCLLAFSSTAIAAEPISTNAANSESKVGAGRTTPSIPTPADVDRWIRDLGHDAFTVRQEAASQLLAAGMAGREQLLEVVEGPDPEKRAAARRLIALIDRSEFRRRLDAFAADTDGRQKLTLPGWEEFQKLAGSDAEARILFVEMQRQEGAILSAVFGASKRSPEEQYEARLLQIAQWQSVAGDRGATPSVGSCATMLFLGSVPQINLSDTAASLIENLIQRPPIRPLVQADNAESQDGTKKQDAVQKEDAARKLVIGWLMNCPNKSEDILRQRLGIIQTLGIKDALALPLSVVSSDPQNLHVLPITKALAAQTIGMLGTREHVDRLAPLLEDSSICIPLQLQVPNQPALNVQVRDVALCQMLLLTQQQPSDYGYVKAQLQSPRNFPLQTLYRENDQQRTEAIAKWRTWWAVHKNDVKANAKADKPAGKPQAAPREPVPIAPQ